MQVEVRLGVPLDLDDERAHGLGRVDLERERLGGPDLALGVDAAEDDRVIARLQIGRERERSAEREVEGRLGLANAHGHEPVRAVSREPQEHGGRLAAHGARDAAALRPRKDARVVAADRDDRGQRGTAFLGQLARLVLRTRGTHQGADPRGGAHAAPARQRREQNGDGQHGLGVHQNCTWPRSTTASSLSVVTLPTVSRPRWLVL